MFKINIYLRFALIAISFIFAIVLTYQSGFLYALPFYLVGLFLIAGYILLGTVMSTAQMIQGGDFEGAEKNLKLTVKPEWLYTDNRGYYYLMQGTISAQKKDNASMEAAFNKALECGLPSDDETAMIHLQLANIAATKNNWRGAQIHFKKLKPLKVREPQLLEQIKQFERALQQRGQMKHQHQGGGKRRRY